MDADTDCRDLLGHPSETSWHWAAAHWSSHLSLYTFDSKIHCFFALFTIFKIEGIEIGEFGTLGLQPRSHDSLHSQGKHPQVTTQPVSRSSWIGSTSLGLHHPVWSSAAGHGILGTNRSPRVVGMSLAGLPWRNLSLST